MNGAADGAAQGVDNPGVYENLPFHGLQQAPNKVNFSLVSFIKSI